MDLAGKTAIVTGAGRDIGRACARQLAAAGANVALGYHASAGGADAAVAEITAAGGRAIAVQADLTDPAAARALVGAAHDTFGSVDILVNNTGGLIARKTIAEMSLDHFRAVMDLNLTSAVMMIQAVLPHMAKGSIVNLASQAGRDGGGAGAVAYAASKGAVMTLTRGLAKELAPRIRVNAVCPGLIDTDFHNLHTRAEVRQTVAAATPLKREGTPDDIAGLVVFLASDRAGFITGANVDINGGLFFS